MDFNFTYNDDYTCRAKVIPNKSLGYPTAEMHIKS